MSPPRKKLTTINVLLPSRILLLVIYDPFNDFIQLVTYQVQTSHYIKKAITIHFLLLYLYCNVMQINFIFIYLIKNL